MAFSLSTEALARQSSRHPWVTIGLWVVVLAVALFLVRGLLSDGLTTEFVFKNAPESKRGSSLLEDRLRGPAGTNEVVVVHSDTLTVDAPEFQQYVAGLLAELSTLGPEVIRQETLLSYYLTGMESLVSEDRHTTIIPFIMAGDFDDANANIHRVVEVVDATRDRSDFQTLLTGQAMVGLDFRHLSQEDLKTAEAVGVPVALVILVLVFGALVAALVPLALAAVVILVALGIAAVVGQVFSLSFFVTNMITMIGLAVGIDYSLFIVARYREERARGLEKLDAISRAGATATRAVFFSGMTVVLALIGMLLVPFNIFISLGLGAIFAVVVAVLAAMTLLPAVLGLLGDRVDKLSIPWIGKSHAPPYGPPTGGGTAGGYRSGGFWDRMSHGVMRQPLASLVIAGGLLVAAGWSFFDLKMGFAGIDGIPDRLPSKQGFLILDEQFSAGLMTPAEVVIDGNIGSPAVQAAIERLASAISVDASFGQPRPLEVNPAGDLALLAVPVAGDAASQKAQDAVTRLRQEYIPAAFESVPAAVYVTGETAFNIDLFNLTESSAPLVFVFVLSVSFLLLMLVFRSIVVPVKAIIMNLLSVGATYGLMVLIFQKGLGNDILGFRQSGMIEAWIPLFLFSVLFGLSMDYHVFLLSRIRERFDQTRDNAGSVAFGIRSTGRLITGAAFIMVAVFWGFAAGDLVGFQQMGFGLGVAILLDATIVRMVLVPASMKLLGDWNWYLPRWLKWLPDVRVEGGEPQFAVLPGWSADALPMVSSRSRGDG